jgi:hypothetical protein
VFLIRDDIIGFQFGDFALDDSISLKDIDLQNRDRGVSDE